MTLQVIGALCIVAALIGGGLKIKEVEIPQLSARQIIVLIVVGCIFVGLGLAYEKSTSDTKPASSSSTGSTR